MKQNLTSFRELTTTELEKQIASWRVGYYIALIVSHYIRTSSSIQYKKNKTEKQVLSRSYFHHSNMYHGST